MTLLSSSKLLCSCETCLDGNWKGLGPAYEISNSSSSCSGYLMNQRANFQDDLQSCLSRFLVAYVLPRQTLTFLEEVLSLP